MMGLGTIGIFRATLLAAVICFSLHPASSLDDSLATVDVHLRLASAGGLKKTRPPAVLWLKPLSAAISSPAPGRYTLLQKNRTFIPHLLVVPVGSFVLFPNEDPFFHNVFSQFDGKRFDLGLYESGSAKGVNFSREGVSYIFCNIHPEMSAVVIAVSTPYYGKADTTGTFQIRGVPAGDYEMHVWIEGVAQPSLDGMSRRIHVTPADGDLGVLNTPAIPHQPSGHLNKFGQPYDRDSKPAY